MAGLRKDVELIFRGQDQASPSIKSVRASVADLTKAIAEQLQAAARGEGSIDDLAKAYNSLKAAQGDVNEIVKLAQAHSNLTTKLAEQSAKVEAARAKEAALAAEMANSATASQRLTNAREAAGRGLQAAISKEQQLQAAVQASGAALEAAGGNSRDFAATQDLIRQAAVETARALRDAAAAMDQFKGKQAGGKTALAAQAETVSFNQLAAGSGLPQAQIAFISTLENRLEALNAAIREDQASMASLNAEIRNNAASDAAGRIRAMSVAMDEADHAAERLKTTTGFKQMAAEIEAGAREVGRFGAVTDTAAVSGQRLADTVQSILNPANAAANSLDGINAILLQSETVVNGAKRRMSEYNAEINNLQSAMAGIQNMAGMIDGFRQQEAVVGALQQKFNAAQAEVIQLAQAMRTADQPTQEMANALQKAEANMENLGGALSREKTKLAGLQQGMKAAKIDTNNLATAQDQLTGAAQRAAAAQTKLRGKTSGSGALFGLNPHEMQNLGFQINDIVVSIASGQAPMRVFLQQGAQIGQIIPGAFTAILRFAGPLAALAAVILVVAGAIKHMADEAKRLSIGQGIAEQMGKGAPATAEQFADLAKTMEDAGAKADKVREILVSLAADGLNDTQMSQYVETAKNLAEVTGVEIPDAIETLRNSFQGGLDDILALDDATNIYTDDQIKLIEKLFEQGKADEARALALGIYQQKQEDVANLQRGPWSAAVKNLKTAWDNFLTSLSNTTAFDNSFNKLRALASLAAYTAARLAGKTNAEALADAKGSKAPPAPLRVNTPDVNRRTNAGRLQAQDDAEALRSVQAVTRAEREHALALKETHDAEQKGLSDLEVKEHVAKRIAIFNATEDKKEAARNTAAGKRAEAAARKREAAAKRIARAAEAEANKIASMEEGIVRALESLDAKVAREQTGDLETRLSAIDSEYAKLFRSIDAFATRTHGKGLIGDRTIEQAREHVATQEKALKNYTTLEFFEKRLGDLVKERDERLDAIADKVARGIIKPDEGLTESQAVIDEMAAKISSMAADGLAFALSIKTAKPDPALNALIEKFRSAGQNNSGGQNQLLKADTAKSLIGPQEQQLNDILSARNDLIQTETTLVELGFQSRKQAESNIQTIFGETQQAILDQIDAIRRMAAAYGTELTPAMQAYFAALESRLKVTSAQTDFTSASFTNLKAHMNELLTTNIVGFIDTVAQSFAKLVTGQGDVMDFLSAIGRAFLMMIANILQTVATLIIEALILDAVDKATGGILKPLLQIMAATASFHHEGGIVGRDGYTKKVNPLVFANAPRYHSGGIAGLAPNESAAILKKGEEVLKESDPRHRDNGGLHPQASAGGGKQGIRQVLAIGDDEIAAAMSGAAGEQTVVTHIKRNKVTIKQILDS